MKVANLRSVVVVTNDSTVFLHKGLASAFEMFGGRVTEIKNFVARLDTATKGDRKLCDVSFGVISTRFGFVPGNYVISKYDHVMDKKEDYIRVQEEKDYLGQLRQMTMYFDRIIVCVPNAMFEMMLKDNTFQHGKVIAVTCPAFKEECEKRGWIAFERKGARLGSANADAIFKLIEKES
ncbi:MAG: hypothetical protein FWC52_00270 [Candidatus Methanoplasma sp.]|nr:hypothetical protein [Candidatus Methanoplasma sp.]